MKIGMHYSIFTIGDNIENSLSYICNMAYNIKLYNENKLLEKYGIQLIIHIDLISYKQILLICNYEKIDLTKIIFVEHENTNNLKGTFWRFQAVIDENYDITMVCEGDYLIIDQLLYLDYFIQNDISYPIFFVINRQPFFKRYIMGGIIIIRPKLIINNIKNKFKYFLELFNNLNYIDYGVDEIFLTKFFEKNLNNINNLIFIYMSPYCNYLKIDNLNKTINDVKKIFPKSTIVTSNVFKFKIYKNLIKSKNLISYIYMKIILKLNIN